MTPLVVLNLQVPFGTWKLEKGVTLSACTEYLFQVSGDTWQWIVISSGSEEA